MGCVIHASPRVVLGPGETEQLYFSVPVELYAHIEIVVNLIVVNFFSFLVIAPSHAH